ncbi:MAG: hypothetical protein ACOX8Q_10180 [Christensenellales bacterium]|jgi:hypothetical protein
MKGLQICAEWKPKESYSLSAREIAKKEVYRGRSLCPSPKKTKF